MKKYSVQITIAGTALAFLCFFLPWMKFISPEITTYSTRGLNGITSPSGFYIATNDTNITTLALITTLLILGLCFYRLTRTTPWKFRTILLILTATGFFCTLYTIIQLNPLLNPETMKLITVFAGTQYAKTQSVTQQYTAPQQIDFDNLFHYKVGSIGTLLGFILVYIGVYNIPKENLDKI